MINKYSESWGSSSGGSVREQNCTGANFLPAVSLTRGGDAAIVGLQLRQLARRRVENAGKDQQRRRRAMNTNRGWHENKATWIPISQARLQQRLGR